MRLSDLYICKKLVEGEIENLGIRLHNVSTSEVLRIAKVLQRSIRPLVQRELNLSLSEREAKRREATSHAEG